MSIEVGEEPDPEAANGARLAEVSIELVAPSERTAANDADIRDARNALTFERLRNIQIGARSGI